MISGLAFIGIGALILMVVAFLFAWALCEASARSEREYEAQLYAAWQAEQERRRKGQAS